MARPTFMLLTLVATLGALRRAHGAENVEEAATISVSGTGKVSAVPDVAEITVGVRTHAPTAAKALAANNEAMNALYAILKERGVAAKDVQTTQLQVNPQYSQPLPPRANAPQEEHIPRVIGYQVDNNVQVTVRKIAELGAMLDALVQAGANQIHGIAFRIGAADALLDDARRRAMSDARRKARLLADEAGVPLGLPIRIQDESAPSVPGPRPLRSYAMAAPAAMPIASGEQELTVTVHVVYRILPGRAVEK